VSRRHGRLEVTEEGCRYRDLGSTNRTRLHRGEQETWLDATHPEEWLVDGDILVLGETRLRFDAAPAEHPWTSPPAETVIHSRDLGQLPDTLRHSLAEADQLRTIYELERKIYLSYDPERMLESIVEAVPEALPQATHVVIVLLDEEGKDFARKLGKVRGEPGPTADGIQISTSMARRVLEERKSLVWRDVPQHFGNSESVRVAGISSSMCAPLWTGEKIVGFLQVDNRSGTGVFTEADLDLLTIFANSAALAIVNRELYAKEQAYARLREIEQMKSQYMRKVSHELRSPLAAIQSTLTVVLEGLAGDVPAKAKDMVARAEGKAGGLLRVTNDLLALSRAREGKLAEQLRPVNLGDAATKVAGLLSARATEGGVQLDVEIGNNLPAIQADPEAAEQLFTNLVGNGIKYTPRDGRVRVSVGRADDVVEIVVSDTGIGIPPEDLDKVFSEFYRCENARQFTAEGTGLGMSIVKAIVEGMGGEVSVDSAVGAGATFRVRVPVPADLA